MRLTVLTIITLTIATATLQQQPPLPKTCSKSCTNCLQQRFGGVKCASCWGKLLGKDGNCLEDINPPKNSNCLIWGKDMDCLECKQGYVNMEFRNTDTNQIVEFCYKSFETSGLFMENFQSGTEPDYQQYRVGRCLNGYPNRDLTACTQNLQSLKELSLGQQAPYCKWGARKSKNTMKTCDYCNKGISVGGRCIINLELPGCIYTVNDPNTCSYCDYENGWRMTTPGVCTKET